MCTSVTIDNYTSGKLVVDFIYFYDDIIVVHNGDDVAGSTVLRPDVKRHSLQKYDKNNIYKYISQKLYSGFRVIYISLSHKSDSYVQSCI